jgi:hypothetical protein
MDVIAFKINIQKKLEDYEQFVDDEGTEESKWIENGDTETAVDEGAFDDGHYDEGDDVYVMIDSKDGFVLFSVWSYPGLFFTKVTQRSSR